MIGEERKGECGVVIKIDWEMSGSEDGRGEVTGEVEWVREVW